ncbi:MAG: UDP-N-acetylmuramoyl-tripeptide--D-alanyl-D-alanine ligase [Acidobacteriota bacterium]|nr:UDP-N-acetylmuramoyl-tripeptide--D-alanyl-D-alanine ligase [Acidobacteriota bacterium]
MELPVGEIAGILGAKDGLGPGTARGYSIDSRSIRPGDLFFAIRGPRFDGHDYVAQVLEKGAVAAVVGDGFKPGNPAWPLIHVTDPAEALQRLASVVRQRWAGPLIGVTGSSGKTTTKEMIAAILGRRFSVLKSESNFNNQYGVPLTLLRLAPEHEIAVLEMAMSAAGEIALLASIARPQTGVVTNVTAAHLAFFDSVDSIARAKRELVEHLASPATAVLNHDDDRVLRFQEGFSGRVATYGFSEGSDFRAIRLRTAASAADAATTAEFEVEGPGIGGWFSIPLPGRHNVENALAAIATGSVFGVGLEDSRAALASLRLPGMRSEVLKLARNITLINDSYNSNPRAMERMIETLAAWPGARRRIVVAGEMLELGPSSPELHKGVGRECAISEIDWVIAVQGDASFILDGARQAGMPEDHLRFFSSAKEAGQFCSTLLSGGDVILLKGSRGVRLENALAVIEKALGSPGRAEDPLS